MTTIDESVGNDFRIGDTLSKVFSVYFRNFIPFNLLVLIIAAPILVLVLFTDILSYGNGVEAVDTLLGIVALIAVILTFVFYFVSAAAITHGVFQDLTGKPVNFTESFSHGLSVAVPTILAGIVVSVLSFLGMMVFFIPGIIIFMILMVTIPVIVIENPGVFASLGRSAELTKGNRWALFGILLIFMVIVIVVSIVGSLISGIIAAMGMEIVGLIVSIAFQIFYTAIGPVLYAVVYNNLRVAKEGISTDQIVSVFE